MKENFTHITVKKSTRDSLKALATDENRSMANMLEVLIKTFLEKTK